MMMLPDLENEEVFAATENWTVPLPVPLDPPVMVIQGVVGKNAIVAAVTLPVSPNAPSVNLRIQVPFISDSPENVVMMLVFGIGFVAEGPPDSEVR